jgi:hypothetical protein
MPPQVQRAALYGPANASSVYMATRTSRVNSMDDLIAAVNNDGVDDIVLSTSLSGVPSLALLSGQSLRSESGEHRALIFREYMDGLRLSSDNTIADVDLITSPDRRSIWNDYSVGSLGTIRLRCVGATGRVQILAKEKIRTGRVEVDSLEIHTADARTEKERPKDYGVYVLQGAFTLWNMQADEDVVLSADLRNISVGRFGSPVLGSGVFVSGAGNKGGRVNVERLETGAVYVDGKIPPGTPDEITGGVFTVYGAYVDRVTNRGPVITYGANDMALDNWGVVDRWVDEMSRPKMYVAQRQLLPFPLVRRVLRRRLAAVKAERSEPAGSLDS